MKLRTSPVKHCAHLSEATAKIPIRVQRDLQETMQDNVGIVRNEAEMHDCT